MPAEPPTSPDEAERAAPSRRLPLPARLVALYLLLHPLAEALAWRSGQAFLNLLPDQRRGWIIYGLAAPFTGWLVWRGHRRARFALYIFMTLEAWRSFGGQSFHLARPWSLAAAVLIVLLFQLPALQRAYPSIERDRYKRLFR